VPDHAAVSETVRAFLMAHPGWTLAEEISARPEAPGTAGPIDGGYAARLELS
jgi:hypothetical protein